MLGFLWSNLGLTDDSRSGLGIYGLAVGLFMCLTNGLELDPGETRSVARAWFVLTIVGCWVQLGGPLPMTTK